MPKRPDAKVSAKTAPKSTKKAPELTLIQRFANHLRTGEYDGNHGKRLPLSNEYKTLVETKSQIVLYDYAGDPDSANVVLIDMESGTLVGFVFDSRITYISYASAKELVYVFELDIDDLESAIADLDDYVSNFGAGFRNCYYGLRKVAFQALLDGDFADVETGADDDDDDDAEPEPEPPAKRPKRLER